MCQISGIDIGKCFHVTLHALDLQCGQHVVVVHALQRWCSAFSCSPNYIVFHDSTPRLGEIPYRILHDNSNIGCRTVSRTWDNCFIIVRCFTHIEPLFHLHMHAISKAMAMAISMIMGVPTTIPTMHPVPHPPVGTGDVDVGVSMTWK